MMVHYRYAVLSFCPNLTDPHAKSVPIAVVGAGAVDAEPRFWFYVSPFQPGNAALVGDDELSRQLLNELPQLVESQFKEAQEQLEVGSGDLLAWLDDRLRNSLHVSAVMSRTEELDAQAFITQLGRLYVSELAPQPAIPEMPVMRMEPLVRRKRRTSIAAGAPAPVA